MNKNELLKFIDSRLKLLDDKNEELKKRDDRSMFKFDISDTPLLVRHVILGSKRELEDLKRGIELGKFDRI